MIIYINKKTRMVTLPNDFLGIKRENLQDDLTFKFNDEFVSGTARLEVMKNDSKSFFMLNKIDESYTSKILSSLLTDDRVLMQLVITQPKIDEGIPIFKSKMFYLKVLDSINAEEEEPEEYSSWIDTANAKLVVIDEEIEKAQNLNLELIKENNMTKITITKKDGTEKVVEIEDGKDYVLTEEDIRKIANETSELFQPQIDNINEEISQLDDTKAERTEIPDVSEFIKKTVNDLVNYYKKSETYTQQEVNQLIGQIKTVSMKLVPERPTIGETNIIYLIPSSKTEVENIYDEYIYVNDKWEKIGSTDIDLSNIYTKDEINQILFDYITSTDLEEALEDLLANIKNPEVIEVGSYQYNYEGKILPAIPVETLKTIYEKDKSGIPLTLHWTLYGSENNLKVVSSDLISGNYSIDVLIHNQYHCEYKWTADTTGNANPNVQSQQEVPAFTNNALGVIKGSTTKGKVKAESDGTGSVNGFNDLVDKTNTGTNILKGKIQIGDNESNIANALLHVRNVSSSITGKNVNGACFSVNADGTASFQHKTYNNDGSGAKNSAVLRFSNQGIQFAVNNGSSSSPAENEYKELATQEYVDNLIGNVDTALQDLLNGGGVK